MKLVTLMALALLPVAACAGTLKMTLSEALKNNSVKMEAVNFAGGFVGKTTRLSITNNTKSAMEITVDIGVILKPADSSYQPMVLAGREVAVVMPNITSDIDVQTFCGDAPNSCPTEGLKYSFWQVGSYALVKVLTFVHDNNLFEMLGQNAVWAMTNGHDVGSVYDPNRDELSKKLQALICTVAGRDKPAYYTNVTIAQVPKQPAYVPKNLKIYADFEIILDAPKTMTLGVFDSAGKMVQPVFENQEFGASGHRFNVEFEAEDVPVGKYYIRLKEADAVLKETMVKVE